MLWATFLQKTNLKNTKVFTQKVTVEIEIVVSTQPLQKVFYNNERMIRVSNQAVAKQRLNFYTNFDFAFDGRKLYVLYNLNVHALNSFEF